MSGVLKLGNVTLGTENSGKVDLTNVGATTADSVTATNLTGTVTNLPSSLTALDTAASNGATSNLDNSALPLFGCRAFVNFNGTSTINVTVNGAIEAHCAIRSSGNVSKVVRKTTGDYEVHFVTAMPDANYCKTFGGMQKAGVGNNGTIGVYQSFGDPTTLQFRILCSVGNSPQDFEYVDVSIFR